MLNKLKAILFTFCVLSMFLCANAAQNQILSTGVRKVSDNTVNFTFYTSGDSLEKPIVKSKGNNEYTILLPNLSDNTSRSINIGATEGIVTSANVKTINEGAVSYTKINVKTSKPVTINAETRKTTQTSSDISNLNSIVSKVNLISQDVKSSANVQTSNLTKIEPAQQSVMKASSVRDIIRQNSASAPKRNAIQQAVAVNTVSAHTPALKKSEKSEISKQKNENIKNIKTVSNVHKTEQVKELQQEVSSTNLLNEKAVMNTALPDDNVVTAPENTVENIPAEEPVTGSSHKSTILDSIKNILFSPITTIVLLACLLLSVFALLFKKLTSNLSVSKSINDSFVEKLNGILNKPKEKDFSQIVNNDAMSWQEKYRAFNETNRQTNDLEHKKIDDNYVLDISNKKTDDEPVEVCKKADKHIFKGFERNTDAPLSRKAMSEKLDKIIDDESSKSGTHNTISNSIKSSSIENMRIMLNRSIDNDKEFYIVSENGEYSLMGRVRNKLLILKRFGQNAPTDLKVLRGQGDAFIVKAGNYKAQINVSDSDMNIYSNV